MKAALLLLALAIGADHPPVQAEGRTWVWCDSLSMYRPDGAGWVYDVDRETWWRQKSPSPWARQPHGTVQRDPATGLDWWFDVPNDCWTLTPGATTGLPVAVVPRLVVSPGTFIRSAGRGAGGNC